MGSSSRLGVVRSRSIFTKTAALFLSRPTVGCTRGHLSPFPPTQIYVCAPESTARGQALDLACEISPLQSPQRAFVLCEKCPVADRPGKLCEGMLHHRSNAFQRFTILFARFTACPFPLFSFSFSELILSPLLLPIVSPLLHLCSEFTRPLGGSFVSFSREQGREKRRKGLLRSSEFYIAI